MHQAKVRSSVGLFLCLLSLPLRFKMSGPDPPELGTAPRHGQELLTILHGTAEGYPKGDSFQVSLENELRTSLQDGCRNPY